MKKSNDWAIRFVKYTPRDAARVMKENGCLLGKGKVNFKRVRDSLETIDFKGWKQIEGALPSGADRRESYQKNTSYLRKIFDI